MRKQNSCREVSYNFKGFALSWIIKIDPKHLGMLTEGLWACCFWAVGKRMWLRHYQWPTLGVFIASEHRADGSGVRRQCTRPGIRADSRVSQSVLWGPSAESVAWEGRLILIQTPLLTASPHVILLHSSLENCFPEGHRFKSLTSGLSSAGQLVLGRPPVLPECRLRWLGWGGQYHMFIWFTDL